MSNSEAEYLAHLLQGSIQESHDRTQITAALPPTVDDPTYLKIWEIEQGHTTTRWTVATFFLSVSFAIFGFSFQAQLANPIPSVARLSGLVIYWFAYVVFVRFNLYTELLRNYMYELEQQKRTTLDIQTRTRRQLRKGFRWQLSATRLLLYFGLFYACGIAFLWWFRV